MTQYISADHHLGHAGIIGLAKRPFDDIDHMNEELIAAWNSVVRPADEVFHLGDLISERDIDKALVLLMRLNGTIYLIPGNHDRFLRDLDEENRPSVKLELLPPLFRLNYNHTKIWLSHYPLRAWEGSFKGALHLYGHTHNTLEADRLPRSMDVGVDARGYYPLSVDEIWRKLSKEPIIPEEALVRGDKEALELSKTWKARKVTIRKG